MCFKQDRAIFTLNDKPLKLVDYFIYLGSNISFTENDNNIRIGRFLPERLLTVLKSNLSNEIKPKFFVTQK